jgi:ABC-type bacteriocin/lantibiotic exporter with double-glycine peptidase domain
MTGLAPFVRHLAGHQRALGILFVLGLVAAAATLSTPLIGKAFVDAVVERQDFATIPWIAAALVALALADLAVGALAARIRAGLSADLLASLRARLFERCTRGPLDDIEKFRHGDLLTRFGTDLPRVEALLVDGLLGTVQHLLFLAVAAAITFALSPSLATWSFAGVAVAALLTAAFRRPVEAHTRRVRDAMADLAHFLSERVGGLRAIRLHGTAADEAARLAQASAMLRDRVLRFQYVDALASGGPALALTAALAWIYIAGAALLETGEISLGTFVAFVLYQGRLFAPAQGLLALLRQRQQAMVALARVGEVLGSDDTGPVPKTGTARMATSADAPAIALHGVTFAYPGKSALFESVDLAIGRGERVALVGASGTGKSTLAHLVFGMRIPSAGAVLVEGRPPGCSAHALAYAGSEPFLLHASVADNLRYSAPHASDAALEQAARLAQAHAFISALPRGYATLIGGRGLALSDGQRQRLGLARLFLRDASILVLDEAFSALDIETERAVRRALWRAFPHCAALVISHRAVGPDEVERVLVLRDGRFTAQPMAQAA